MAFIIFPIFLWGTASSPLWGEDHNGKEPSSSERGVYISAKQRGEISFILAEASHQTIEKWIRTSGSANFEGKFIRGRVYGKDKQLIRVGQKVRIFPLIARDPVLQVKIAHTYLDGDELVVETDLQPRLYEGVQLYIMEIIVDLGQYLAIPNEAIIEEQGKKRVYVQQDDHYYSPRELVTGLRGEIYTQVLGRLETGEKIVTFGSFFIDAQYKFHYSNGSPLDSNKKEKGSFAHHHH